jgi:hypothetical protein
MKRRSAVAIAALAAALACGAQQMPSAARAEKSKPATGSITGTVFCGDTNLPARLAEIYLVQVGPGSHGSAGHGSTDLEGRFTVNRVAVGNYFVVAVLPGYLNLLGTLNDTRLDAMTPEERAKVEAGIPSVTVSAKQPAEASIRLDRAAEIDGTVLYDDGSPATSVMVHMRPKPETPESVIEEMGPGLYGDLASLARPLYTDDRGRFRILGVAPGEYLVSATVSISFAEDATSNPFMGPLSGGLVVYPGGVFRAAKAKSIKVGSGETSADADITIPLSKLHRIRGHVVLKSTGQAPPAAVVELVYADSKEPARMTTVPGGDFEFRYVPEDSYVIEAVANPEPLPNMDGPEADEPGNGSGGTIISSGFSFSVRSPSADPETAAEIPLLVTGDVDDVNLTVPDPPAKSKGRSPIVVGKETTDESAPESTPQ